MAKIVMAMGGMTNDPNLHIQKVKNIKFFKLGDLISSTYLIVDKKVAIYLQWLKSDPRITTMVKG